MAAAPGVRHRGRRTLRLFHHEHERHRHVGRHPPRVFHAARRRAAPSRAREVCAAVSSALGGVAGDDGRQASAGTHDAHPGARLRPADGVFRVRDAATPGGVRSVRRSRRAEGRVRARHRRRSSRRRRRRTSRKRQGVRGGARARPRAALHGRGEAPEEPGASMREDLRVWPGMRVRDGHQRLHQTRRRRRRRRRDARLRKPIATSRASPRHRRGGRRRARGTLRRRGRRGARRHVRRVRRVGRRRGSRDVDPRRRRGSRRRRRREASVCRGGGRDRRPTARRVGSRVRAGRSRGCDGPVERAAVPRRGRWRDRGTSGKRR